MNPHIKSAPPVPEKSPPVSLVFGIVKGALDEGTVEVRYENPAQLDFSAARGEPMWIDARIRCLAFDGAKLHTPAEGDVVAILIDRGTAYYVGQRAAPAKFAA